ncbi:MAG: hemerythrin domain-containing protein [Phycisphaerales bacterium]|nr:hemerythrin domain-containing protein [Phycisphaerales bacterium]
MDGEPTPPLKRHAALVPLSREHMNGLIQARNLQRAAGQDGAARAVAAFVDAWNAEIREHFDDEERLLLPLTGSPALRRRLLGEHDVLRGLAARCEADPAAIAGDPATMRRLGTLLNDHIRWEEREFFEVVQREHPGALDAMEHEAAIIERRRPGARARQVSGGKPATKETGT